MGMLDKHLVFTMVRHEVLRLDQVQHQLLFLHRRVTGCMERSQRRVGNNVCTDSGQLVDNTGYGSTVAWNRIG